MKNKKGFTLVELLAVIVILAVIALIATPTVLSLVNKSRQKAAEQSMLTYVKTIQNAILVNMMYDGTAPTGTATLSEDGKSITVNGSTLELDVSGDKPTTVENQSIEIDTTGDVKLAKLKFGNYYVLYEFSDKTATYCSQTGSFPTSCPTTSNS